MPQGVREVPKCEENHANRKGYQSRAACTELTKMQTASLARDMADDSTLGRNASRWATPGSSRRPERHGAGAAFRRRWSTRPEIPVFPVINASFTNSPSAAQNMLSMPADAKSH